MICVQCGASISQLFRQYSAKNIRLTVCYNCNQVADHYIEHYNSMILFVDLLLHKPSVYRHIFYNRLPYQESLFDQSNFISRFMALLLLFDTFTVLVTQSQLSYVQAFQVSCLQQLAFHVVVRFFVYLLVITGFRVNDTTANQNKISLVKYNYASITLVISSFPKLLLVLMIIWNYDQTDQNSLQYLWLIELLTFTSQVEGLQVYLDGVLGYIGCAIVIGAGFAAQSLTRTLIIR